MCNYKRIKFKKRAIFYCFTAKLTLKTSDRFKKILNFLVNVRNNLPNFKLQKVI